MGLLSFIKSLVFHDNDSDFIESVTQQPVKNINNQVDLGNAITDDMEKSASEEVHEVSREKKDTATGDVNEDKSEVTAHKSDAYNLIILDESGSMSTVRDATISGCNETLISIRNIQKEQPSIRQYVSIFCFDSSHSRYIFHDTPVDEVRDMTRADYNPSACTPLYDAIGYTVLQLFRKINRQEAKGNVTIITDGYENASRKWRLPLVQELIATLKSRGWVFSFIGANIDVERTANSLGIDSFMGFEQTQTGMEDMFECERRSRRAFNEKRRYMQMSRSFCNMSEEEQTGRRVP